LRIAQASRGSSPAGPRTTAITGALWRSDTRELRKRGTYVCRHRVARLMREQQLQARPRRRFVSTTDSRHSLLTPPNVLDRDFTTTAPNRAWVGDVTYLRTLEGWLYLAVLLDLYSRCVVGWAMSEHNDEALTLSALQMALDQRQPGPGLIHHTDRGTTYGMRCLTSVVLGCHYSCNSTPWRAEQLLERCSCTLEVFFDSSWLISVTIHTIVPDIIW